MFGFYRFAAVSPKIKVADIAFNTAEIIKSAQECTKNEVSEEWSQVADPGRQWTLYSLPMEYKGTPKGIYLTLPEAGSVELRNMQIATPEGTVMMEYCRE